jgi:hypothetical protein
VSRPFQVAVLLIAAIHVGRSGRMLAQIAVQSNASLSVDSTSSMSVPLPLLPGFVDLSHIEISTPGGGGAARRKLSTAALPSRGNRTLVSGMRATPPAGFLRVPNRKTSSVPRPSYWNPVADTPGSNETSFTSQSVRRIPDSLGTAGNFGNNSFGLGGAKGAAGSAPPNLSLAFPAAPVRRMPSSSPVAAGVMADGTGKRAGRQPAFLAPARGRTSSNGPIQ